MRHRDRVKVGEEEEAVAALRGGIVLHPHPVADRAQIIAEVQISGGLDARYDPHGLLLCRRRSVAGAPPREHGEQILVKRAAEEGGGKEGSAARGAQCGETSKGGGEEKNE